jgi:four helix bundle protein
MLRIHSFILVAIRKSMVVVEAIERHDRELAAQMKRAMQSCALNCAEGSGLSGGNRVQRYRSVIGSGREVMSAMQVAEAMGYVRNAADEVAMWSHVVAVHVKIVVPRGALTA